MADEAKNTEPEGVPADVPPTPESPEVLVQKWKFRATLAALVALVVGLVVGGLLGWGLRGDGGNDTASAGTTTTTSAKASTTFMPTTTTAPTTTTSTAPPAPVEVLRVSGANDDQTENFTVVGGWEITANVTGGAGISIRIMSPGGSMVDSVSFDPGTNTSRFRGGGTFWLDVSTFGASYEVIVTDTP
jgi:hypothetical protein